VGGGQKEQLENAEKTNRFYRGMGGGARRESVFKENQQNWGGGKKQKEKATRGGDTSPQGMTTGECFTKGMWGVGGGQAKKIKKKQNKTGGSKKVKKKKSLRITVNG